MSQSIESIESIKRNLYLIPFVCGKGYIVFKYYSILLNFQQIIIELVIVETILYKFKIMSIIYKKLLAI